jgi:hypothetical protein
VYLIDGTLVAAALTNENSVDHVLTSLWKLASVLIPDISRKVECEHRISEPFGSR